MREIKIYDVREGDVARSNGREFRVAGVLTSGHLILHQGEGSFALHGSPSELTVLGVTFWREERKLPGYPGAVVSSGDGHRRAVRARNRGESFALWLTTTDCVPWKTEPELLEWLGPNWQEMTTAPSAREWVPVDAGQVREGDFVRFEWADGDAVEGVVTEDGDEHEVGDLDISVIPAERGQWFKREEQTGERG